MAVMESKNGKPRESTDVLVLARDAPEYLEFLQELAAEGVSVVAASSVSEARAVGSGRPVLLAQPDLAADLLSDWSGVRWIQSTWAGVTPLLEIERRDYLLTSAKGVFGREMAEYVLGYLLAHELKLLERLGRQANRSWWPEPSGTLAGKALGIMGTGSIGRHIAAVARSFGARLLGYSLRGRPVDGFDEVYAADQLPEFLARIDYLVCVLPDTPRTQRLLDDEAIRNIRPGCYLVNVGRGNLLDEAALVAALESGRLAGAVLDVFGTEPLPEDSALWHAPNTLVTAHVAARSWPRDIAALFLENYRRYVRGEPLAHTVNFERGY
jgi:phosphoglycerate dehydrogenase-like enzyme